MCPGGAFWSRNAPAATSGSHGERAGPNAPNHCYTNRDDEPHPTLPLRMTADRSPMMTTNDSSLARID